MSNKLTKLFHSSFAQGALWMTAGIMLLNLGAFFFLFILARLLAPTDYAHIVVFISIVNILSITSGILQLTVVRMIAQAKSQHDIQRITIIFRSMLQNVLVIGALFILVAFVLQAPLGTFLHIDTPFFFVLAAATAVAYLFVTLLRSVFQGLLAFVQFTVSAGI